MYNIIKVIDNSPILYQTHITQECKNDFKQLTRECLGPYNMQKVNRNSVYININYLNRILETH